MEDFVTFEIAKKLKENGFRCKCLAYYDVEDNVGLLYNTQYSDELLPCQYTELLASYNSGDIAANLDTSDNCIDAPTISQVLEWLRNEKNIFVVVFIDDDSDYPVTYNIFRGTDFVYHHHGNYFTLSEWSECEMAGIEYVIDNLI